MKRVLLVAGALLVVALVAAVVILLRGLDRLVEGAIEEHGSRATGTPVRVDSVEIRLREGRGTVRGLSVGNPEGFDAPHAMAWEAVTIDINPGSVTSQPYVVNEVVIEAPTVLFEVDERGRVNLRVLQEKLRSGGGGGSQGASGPEPKLRIRSFRFERGVVEARTAKLGGKDLRAELPPLVLTDLGGAGGDTPGGIARSVLRAYTEQALRTAARREIDRRLTDVIDKELGGEAAGAAKQLLKGLLDR